MSSAAPFSDVRIEVHEGAERLPIAALANYPQGQAPDVIWLHANGFNARTYRHTLGPLTGRLNILAVDQRGHGATPQPSDIAGKTDASDMRDDLLALLEAIDAPAPVVLAGHSIGGCVAMLAAAEAPRRVRALALFDPVIMSRETMEAALRGEGMESVLVSKARGRRRSFASKAEALETYGGRSIFRTWPREALEDYVEAGFRELPDGSVELTCAPEWEAAVFASHAHDIWGAMSRVEAPVRIWRAEIGSTCAVATSAEFPRPPGQAEVVTVAGATHFLPIERPELVREGLLAVASL